METNQSDDDMGVKIAGISKGNFHHVFRVRSFGMQYNKMIIRKNAMRIYFCIKACLNWF